MKRYIPYLVLLGLILTLSVGLLACTAEAPPENPPTQTGSESESVPTQSKKPSPYQYSLAEYSVVRPQNADIATLDAVTRFYEYLVSLGNEEPTVTDDYGLSADISRKEILIGLTALPESAEAAKLLSHELDYAIVFHESKIVIVAGSELALSEAIDRFFSELLSKAESGILSVEVGYSLVAKADLPEIILYQNKQIRYNIVLPDSATAADEALAASIAAQLEIYTGNIPEIVEAKTAAYKEDTHSILIGNVGYPESEAVHADLKPDEYAVRVVGNKVVVAGHFAITRENACKLFLSEMAKAASKESDTMKLYVTDQWEGNDSRFLFDFPQFTDGKEELSIDNENNTLMLGYTDVTDGEFTAYCERLTTQGYALWQENQIGANRFRTYRNGQKELCLSFYPNLSGGTLHLFADGHQATVMIPDADPNYEKVREMTLYNISFDYSNKSVEDGYGMSYVIALEDGRYVVIDGGHSASSGSKADERLYRCMVENNKRPDGKIVIAAWFMSHPHGDHFGAFQSFVPKYGKNVTLECFVANPYSAKMNTEGEWFTGTMLHLLAQMKAPLIKPHTGQILTFCNTELEVVFTHENHYPRTNFGANDASTVIRLRQNGHTALFSADSCKISCKQMVKLYGDELRSEIFQVNHHGHSGGTWEFYDLATYEDSYVLWTCPEEFFYYRTLGYFVDGKSIVAMEMLLSNRDLALKVGFERNFYAEGAVEAFIFPPDGEITLVGEKDLTRDPTTYTIP